MISFYWPWLLLLLPLPWLIRAFQGSSQLELQSPIQAPFYQQIKQLQQSRQISSSSHKMNFVILSLIWTLLLIASARPQWLGEPLEIPLSGRDLMLAVDVSGSMETPDFSGPLRKETRLDVVKRVAEDFIQNREGDRLGLIVFGTQAFVQAPLTFDTKAVAKLLTNSEIGLAGEKTAIGDAIGLALKQLNQQQTQQKVLVLLTDGANNEGSADPKHAADLASEQGLKIYTIGIGARQMKVQGFFGSQLINPSADLDENTLRYIAQKTGGQYFRATDEKRLRQIYQQLDDLNPIISDKQIYRPVQEMFIFPLAAAFFISFLFALVPALQNVLRKKYAI